jgi:hypothetical protein
MAYEQPVILDSEKNAYTDLRLKQYFAVKETSNGIELCAAATDVPAGVLQNQPNAGEPAQIMRLGISKFVSGGVIGVGTLIGTDADGKADVKVPGTDTTNYVIGKALEVGASGQIISAAINCITPHRAA